MINLLIGVCIGIALGVWFSRIAERGRAQRRKVLELLSRQDLYGLELVQRSQGLLSRGLVYPLLHSLENEEMILSRPEPATAAGNLPRRIYSLTAAGRVELANPNASFPQRLRTRLGTDH